jgi:uncharacterized phage protein (TIGR01671 family)
MREILFMGKTDKGKWVYGVPFFEEERCYIIEDLFICDEYDCTGAVNTMVIPETVGQYTGLTDKNGTKIFEGDIILFEDESPTNYEYHDCTEMRCGEIKFDDGQYYLTNRIAVEMGDLIYDGKLEGEVIGNMHDNPELLGGGEE